MNKAQSTHSTEIYLLRLSDEMRHPYESALTPICSRVRWFSTYEELLAVNQGSEPMAVIVDLDCLRQPLEAQLEHLRAVFNRCDLIALSSSDSAQVALQCLRSGFSDFLVKPTSPEELGWSLRKAKQRFEFFQRLNDPKTRLVRAVTQISTCTTPTLVRLTALEYLQTLFGSEGAAWVGWDRKAGKFNKVVCSIPKETRRAWVLKCLPRNDSWVRRGHPVVVRRKRDSSRRIFLPLEGGGVFVWGIPAAVSSSSLTQATALLEHCKLSLLNIQKLDEIRQQTFLDDLTGLYNSRYLKFALTNAILKCKQPGHTFAVLFIDVDYFKAINDRYGHQVGSEFLVAIGKTIKNAVRNIDPVFRYGGDEFVVILHNTNQEGAAEIGERIRKNIERRVFLIKNQRIQTTVSIGIAVYPEHANERESLLRLADEAMYAAKKNTRNAVHLAYGLNNPAKARRAR